ncbi:MAG: AsnC family transcriptional regulator [Osedax symbiont Rs2]|nr:MAG: AsnC family transcriptional regulator [Osedax symbiont Rs2]
MNIDRLSWKIINEVQKNGRVSLKALASEVGLSLPATSERLKRLEEAGVIEGYRAIVSPEVIGYGVTAIIGMTAQQPEKARFIKMLRELPEVLECLHVTGQDSYVLRVVTKDLRHLESFVESINIYGETRTSIVMSHPIPLRKIMPPKDP